MRTSAYLLLPALLLASLTASAQRRIEANTAFIPEVQAEWALNGNDYLMAGFNVVAQKLGENSSVFGGQLRLGYEHFWNEQWSWGGTLRLLRGMDQRYGDFLGQPGNVTPGLLLRHSGKIGSLNFGQRLGVEYAISTSDALSIANQNRGLARLRLDLERQFPLGATIALRPRLAYEVGAYTRLQRDETELKERVVDFGSLRGEVGIRVSSHIDVTPWVASQTSYNNFLPQYDAAGKQVSGGRTNIITPVFGLDARFTVFRDEPSPERKQLPTQH
ncbi:hypothetical protein SAMN06265337_2909 [Hymenobacter gelipurpurascens]|uniref:Outer membrane protein beta-barrel domain-containing protein n=1 Tax=Hymenobacter gelipurpurascens TaxID=89968 RepID=A0A212UB75_9BACT|nr:hypothetical protein SAMN06265337_2909 [Hymenobacter gelipurpurascens]